ncbi:uncharacterized protein PF3D7_1120000-like [Penaeus vannamei]|uniref:uncharacterized protein PF3D7_1120000-like n=1 Tax=Penaeus vannamei TaxID=6689 RepID=UPI00387F938B
MRLSEAADRIEALEAKVDNLKKSEEAETKTGNSIETEAKNLQEKVEEVRETVNEVEKIEKDFKITKEEIKTVKNEFKSHLGQRARNIANSADVLKDIVILGHEEKVVEDGIERYNEDNKLIVNIVKDSKAIIGEKIGQMAMEGGGGGSNTNKERITKELEISQDPIVEMKVIEVETNGANIMIATVYMPPQTPVWSQESYLKPIQETLKSLEEVLRLSETNAKEILITWDFKSKFDWEGFDPRAQPHSWDANLQEVINEYCLYQNETDHTKVRGLGKSDHAVIKLKYCLLQEKHRMQGKKSTITREIIIYFFDGINWETLLGDENLVVQYSKFCEIYKTGVEKFSSKFKTEARNSQKWFNDKCKKMRENKQLLWKRFRRQISGSV